MAVKTKLNKDNVFQLLRDHWKQATGLRDRIVHGYFNVDLEIIWDVINTEIPILKQQIETIIQDLEEQ